MLSEQELKLIEERCNMATQGPWMIDDETVYSPSVSIGPLCDDGDRWLDHDAYFITRSRTDIPALLSHIREQEAKLAHMQRAQRHQGVTK